MAQAGASGGSTAGKPIPILMSLEHRWGFPSPFHIFGSFAKLQSTTRAHPQSESCPACLRDAPGLSSLKKPVRAASPPPQGGKTDGLGANFPNRWGGKSWGWGDNGKCLCQGWADAAALGGAGCGTVPLSAGDTFPPLLHHLGDLQGAGCQHSSTSHQMASPKRQGRAAGNN